MARKVSPGMTPVMVPVKVGLGVLTRRVTLLTVTVRGSGVTVSVVVRAMGG